MKSRSIIKKMKARDVKERVTLSLDFDVLHWLRLVSEKKGVEVGEIISRELRKLMKRP